MAEVACEQSTGKLTQRRGAWEEVKPRTRVSQLTKR